MVREIERNTIQRQIILDALKSLNNHPTVEEVYVKVQKGHPTISKTTVYRNLRQLAMAGMIRGVSLDDNLERYDDNPHRHYHFRCKDCGVILDVEIDYLESVDEIVCKRYGYQVNEHDLVFTGCCRNCTYRS